MKTLSNFLLLFIIAALLSACSYTPEQEAEFAAKRAYWEQNNGYGASAR